MSFETLGLKPELLRALSERGYNTPTAIQARAIPEILNGRDILAGAQTGSGKTAGFTLPLLQRLSEDTNARGRAPRALILVPTRELAAQVGESVRSYGKYLRLRWAAIFGGVSINPQIDVLERGVDVLIATPGRLLDHAQQENVDLSHVQILVLDEADRMLDMGFIHDMKRIFKRLPRTRQNLMFSATYSDDIRRLAQSLLHQPLEIDIARRNAAVESVEQHVIAVAKEDKRAVLSQLIRGEQWSQVLVFTRTKHGANRLARQLEEDGIRTAAIHGNKSQSARVRALADFKSGAVVALVATEVAARGLDIHELPHVVNFELPNVAEDYVHRIGRTGRAGASGTAISLVSNDEAGLLKDIERLIGRSIARMQQPVIAARPAPNATPPRHHEPTRPHQARPQPHRHRSHQRAPNRSSQNNERRRGGR